MHGHNLYGMISHIDPRIGLAAFSVFIAIFMLVHPVSTEQTRHEMQVTINSSIEDLSVGVAVDGDRIDFGSLPDQTVHASRDIAVQNIEQYPATLHFHTEGNISEYIIISEEHIELEPGDYRVITITLETSDDMLDGTYSGEIMVYTRRPLYQFLLDRL